MGKSLSEPLAELMHSSTKYAETVSRLSDLISETQKKLAAMPGKAEVSVFRNEEDNSDGLHFFRGSAGIWQLFYQLSPADLSKAREDDEHARPVVNLLTADVECKLKAASLLVDLIRALSAELKARATRAQEAAAYVESLWSDIPKGGA